MAGSIRKRADKGPNAFELRVYLGRDPSGRVRHKSKLFRGTKRAAERELARLLTEQEEVPAVVSNDGKLGFGTTTTINAAIAGWKLNGWQDLSPSTTRRYTSIWNTHIKNSIGRRAITSLGPYDVELYLRGLKDAGLSESSVRQTRAMLHRACRLARKWSGNDLPNPVADTELPDWALHEQAKAVRAPNIEEVRSLLASSVEFGLRMTGFVTLVAATGMRRGEACALRWSNVDFEAALVTIDESIVSIVGGTQVKSPKSRAGVRTVAVDQVTLAVLTKMHADLEDLARVGEFSIEPDHFVFAKELPGVDPPHPDAMSHAFTRIRESAGVAADVHIHSLRHFQATALDAVISEAQKQSRLGWSTVHMARHYTDAVMEEDRLAATHIGDLLAGTAGSLPQS